MKFLYILAVAICIITAASIPFNEPRFQQINRLLPRGGPVAPNSNPGHGRNGVKSNRDSDYDCLGCYDLDHPTYEWDRFTGGTWKVGERPHTHDYSKEVGPESEKVPGRDPQVQFSTNVEGDTGVFEFNEPKVEAQVVRGRVGYSDPAEMYRPTNLEKWSKPEERISEVGEPAPLRGDQGREVTDTERTKGAIRKLNPGKLDSERSFRRLIVCSFRLQTCRGFNR